MLNSFRLFRIKNRLIGRRDGFGFLKFDIFGTAGNRTCPCFDAEYLSAANFTLISLTKLTCHEMSLLERLLFLQFHLLTATGDSAGTRFGHNELTAALSTAVSLANLICHVLNTFP